MSVTRRSAFAAYFDVLGGQSLPGELIYTASHPQYGPLQIFLSEAGSALGGCSRSSTRHRRAVPPPVRAAAAFGIGYRPEREEDHRLPRRALRLGARRRSSPASAGRRRCSPPSSTSSSMPSSATIARLSGRRMADRRGGSGAPVGRLAVERRDVEPAPASTSLCVPSGAARRPRRRDPRRPDRRGRRAGPRRHRCRSTPANPARTALRAARLPRAGGAAALPLDGALATRPTPEP